MLRRNEKQTNTASSCCRQPAEKKLGRVSLLLSFTYWGFNVVVDYSLLE
jgi:hypothetical protein